MPLPDDSREVTTAGCNVYGILSHTVLQVSPHPDAIDWVAVGDI